MERVVLPDENECWSAVARRDAAADGRFLYAVVTTGIYCRPSCPTPTPLRRNVRFFPDPAAAEAAGFCACKRCRPTLPWPLAGHVAAVGKACAILSTSERAPSLAAVAAAVGISRFHFYRVFKDVLGTTPGEYFNAVRWRRLTQSLAAGRPVAEAIYAAGYGSISRAYENARKVTGIRSRPSSVASASAWAADVLPNGDERRSRASLPAGRLAAAGWGSGPAGSAVQSGRANTKRWVLELEPTSPP